VLITERAKNLWIGSRENWDSARLNRWVLQVDSPIADLEFLEVYER